MKVKIIRGVLYNRKPLKVGTVINLQEGIAAAFISQNQAELVEASPEEGEVDASKSGEETKPAKTKTPKTPKTPKTKK